ncbi:hypothetical protein C5O80_31050 [Burkholderia sp. SRS-46]|nr:hypothetical protein C5O80_31050 [Burkholderia sp. SRS-46]
MLSLPQYYTYSHINFIQWVPRQHFRALKFFSEISSALLHADKCGLIYYFARLQRNQELRDLIA